MNVSLRHGEVIKVAPFALSSYITPYGHRVILSELLWVVAGSILVLFLWVLKTHIKRNQYE